MEFILFLLEFYNFVFLGMFAILLVVALVNFVVNPYSKQNSKLSKFRKKILAKPSSLSDCICLLPTEYQRQWRAYLNSGAQKPSAVFEFVKKPFRYKLWFLHLIAVLLDVAYLVLSVLLSNGNLFSLQLAYLLASVLAVILAKLISNVNLACARKQFGKFVQSLCAVVDLNKRNQVALTQSSTVEQISQLVDQPTQNVVDKAVQILKQKGLDSPRTADEQRKLNLALNGLLQACSKRK